MDFAFDPSQLAREGSRALAYGLREVSRTLLSSHQEDLRGLFTCGFPMDFLPEGESPDWVGVSLHRVEEGGEERWRARLHGIRTCGSPWACPVCSRSIAEDRGEALSEVLAHLAGQGYRVAHVVLTVRHTRADALEAVFGALTRAWRRMKEARGLRALWEGVEWARSIEVTLGRNGWHPHVHLVLLVPPGRDPWELKGVVEAWLRAVEAEGWEALPDAQSFQVAAEVEDVREVGRYVAKPWGVGWEVSGGALKAGEGGLSPWEILGAVYGAYLEGHPSARAFLEVEDWEGSAFRGEGGLILREFCWRSWGRAKRAGFTPDQLAYRWVQYALATKGRKLFTASRRLGLLLRAFEPLKEEAPPVEVVYLARNTYLWLLRSGRLGYWLHLAEATGSLVLACELLGLVPGEEWARAFMAQAPPLSQGGLEEVVFNSPTP